MLNQISNTKQIRTARRSHIYNYYAGFTDEFCKSLIDYIGIDPSETVIDPWNGSGTTTTCCAINNIKSTGIDINPFMAIVARLRATQDCELLSQIQTIERALSKFALHSGPVDPQQISLEFYIFATDENNEDGSIFSDVLKFLLGCVCREASARARSQNPTWYSLKMIEGIKIDSEAFKADLSNQLQQVRRWLAGRPSSSNIIATPILVSEDFGTWSCPPTKYDHVITSPPYLTRIDYVQKTLPELLFLKRCMDIDLVKIRRQMLGSVLTERISDGNELISSPTALRALEKIKSHHSKASATYYFRFYGAYIRGLQSSIAKISRITRSGGTCTLVTQGSFYKDIFVDLPIIVDELIEFYGYYGITKSAFDAKYSMVSVNVRSYASTQNSPQEIVSVYRKI
ncbi:MAG: hypothetical protein V7704_05175 [Aurantimonas endophytica]|uniref:hypothetical protein n=1 Tax=Aurantimonas endophytica TaxID=1522175 RepID=UPI00300161A1